MPDGRRPTILRGREPERRVLDALVDRLDHGESAALVIRGEPGVGKTTLLGDLVERHEGACRIEQASGAEFEMEFAYAALHQLCSPMLDRLDALPLPHRRAISSVFGLDESPTPPDPFFVALAVLGLLTEAAEERPLICIVDDAHALDRESVRTLAFVARRLQSESVALVFAVRRAPPELAGLPELVLQGLSQEHAGALLDASIGAPLDAAVRDQILAETRGNPLAVLELPRGSRGRELAGGFVIPQPGSLAGRIEQSFLDGLDDLPQQTRRLLVLAAAEPTGDPLLLRRAASRLGLRVPTTTGQELARFIEFAPRIRFRHPLVRSAIYGAADAELRRWVHHALAEATDADVDPDRRIWHLAQTVDAADEEIAAELERSADRARSRGGLAAAAAFLALAAQLTPDLAQRARRALDAAIAEARSGNAEAALALLLSAEAGPLDDRQLARAELLRGQIAFYRDRGGLAPELLLKAARRLARYDTALARETYLEALTASGYAGRLASGAPLPEVASAVRASAPPADVPRPIDLLLDAYVTWVVDGSDAGAPLLREANRALLDEPVPSPESLRWMWFGVVVAMDSWDDEMWTVLSERQVQVARESGALVLLGIALAQLGAIRMLRGDFAAADAMFEEAMAVSRDTGTPPPHYLMLALHGFRGDVAAFDAIAPGIIQAARESGEGLVLSMAELTRALLCNGWGNYAEALESARSMHEHAPFLYESLMLIEYVEAAVRCGDGDAVDEAFASLERSTSSASGAWGRGLRALAEALVGGDDPHVEARYIAALDLLGRSGMLPYLGRAHLLYGEWLRRVGRRADSRQQLRTAHELLTRIGCRGFADRAGRELDVTGETIRRGGSSIRDQLTRQELQVAQMAAEGLSNREIGQRLYLSHRTVSSHLYRAFPKLGITSRTQLHLVLPQLAD